MDMDNSHSLSVEQGIRNSLDEACFRRIFPEEIWVMVLNYLSPSSRETMLCSQPFFRRILLPTRHEFLFPKVWEVFATLVETDLLPSYHTHVSRLRVINPIMELVKSARLVCKDWCREIDNFYDHLKRRLDMGEFDELVRHRVGDWIQFNRLDYNVNGARFVRHFQSTHAATERNPFLGRRLSLKFDQFSPYRYLRQDVDARGELFAGYGHHIWYLEVTLAMQWVCQTTIYSWIIQWLQLTPNLKSFKWSLTDHDRYDVIENSLLPPDSIIHSLRDILEHSPFPRLEQLKLLHLGVPQILAEHLITVNNHVEVIEYCGPINWEIMMLPRLKKLCLLSGRVQDLEGLDGGRSKDWKLEALRLDLNDDRPYIPYERILSIVEIWKDSLVTVELSLPAARTVEELQEAFESMKGARSSLPRVKTFKLALRNRLGIEYAFPRTDRWDKQSHIQWDAYEDFQIYHNYDSEDEDEDYEIVQCQVIHFRWEAGTTSETFGIEGWKNFPTMGNIIGVQIPDM